MLPKLYAKNENNFEHNGLGILRDCISCKVTEEDNGIFELELTYKVNSFLFDEIVNHNIIKAKASDELGEQLFRIYWVSNELDGTIQVKAQHITYDLRDNFVENVTSTNATCQEAFNYMLSKCINSHRFKGYSDIEHTATYNLARVNALEAIKGTRGSLADTYGNGAKLKRDNFNIYLNKDRGKNNNVLIAYKKNITGYTREIDESEVVTVIYPFAKIEKQVGEGESVEETIVLPERFIQSKYINNYPHPKVLPIDYSGDEAIKDIATLRNKANKYFSETKKDIPSINYKVEFIDLSKTSNYKGLGLNKLEKVGLGDTVIVRDFRIGMNVEARVIKTVFDSLNDKYVSIELGKFKRSLADINNNINSSIENGLDSVRKDMYVNFEVLDDKITSEVSKLDGDIKTHTTLIQQTAEAIKQVAKDVEGNTSLIEQTAGSIDMIITNKADKNEVTDEINQSVNTAKEALELEINGVSTSLGDLSNTMNTTFKDGVVDEAEAKSIGERIIQLDKEKADLDKQYTTVYSNVDLTGISKSNLLNSKNDYDLKHKDLRDYINNAISDKKVTVEEMTNINTKMSNYNASLSNFNERLQQAIDAIANKKKQDAINSANNNTNEKFSQISQTVENITLQVGEKVGNDEIISAINLSPENIKINSKKINLYGYVEISDLEGNGTVVINGGNIQANTLNGNSIIAGTIEGSDIKAGTIACDMLSTPAGREPVINLFSDYSRNCQIDARNSDGGSKGSAIRLKYDDSNYLFINSNGISAFIGGSQDFVVNETGVLHKGTYLSKNGHTHNYANSYHNHYLLVDDYNGTARVAVFGGNSAWRFRQHCSVEMYLGDSGNRWGAIYSNTGTIQTSSKKHKKNIEYLNDMQGRKMFRTSTTPFIDFMKDKFKPATYRLIAKNTDADTNEIYNQIGFIAEDVANTNIGKTFIYNVEEDETKENDYMYSTSGYVTVVATALQEEIIKREEENAKLKDIINRLDLRLQELERVIQ